MKLKNLREVILFGKVLSAGILIAGYAFLGVWCCEWLVKNGWPLLLGLCVIIVVTGFGVWQAYLFVKKWRNI
ncbi:MAG: hypothetical protein IJT21_00535 [Synergistaceae bacterium]|nr:hypothetical protein [Synergistaceae bacterium]